MDLGVQRVRDHGALGGLCSELRDLICQLGIAFAKCEVGDICRVGAGLSGLEPLVLLAQEGEDAVDGIAVALVRTGCWYWTG